MKNKNTNAVVKRKDEAPRGLLDRTNPIGLVEGATVIADQLSRIITDQKLYQPIKGKKHVKVEGWTTLGAMSGVFPYVEYARRVKTEDPKEIQYEARVLAKTRDGDVIGAAEAICSNREQNWRNKDEYAIKSMAQTRATSKALRLPLGWIMTLSGFDPTPAEEIPENGGFNDAVEAEATVSEPKKSAVRSKIIPPEKTDKEPVRSPEGSEGGLTPTEALTTGRPADEDAVRIVDEIVDELLKGGNEDIVEADIIAAAEARPGIRAFQLNAIRKYLGVD